jgi:DNA polymerase III epsilon subunit-like protein
VKSETVLVCDIETDGFKPTVIWCVGIIDLETDEYTAYYGDDIPEGLLRLADADRVVGHYFKGYDAPVIEKLTEGLVKLDPNKIDDTCEISRALFPEMPDHKLETWGEVLGLPKGKFKDFSKFSNEMLVYLERDVRLNALVYRTFLDEIARLS